MQKAVIIIPTYNERENVKLVIPKLLHVFQSIKNWDMHILVVDDSSPDKTYEVVQEIEKKEKKVELFLNKKKSGLGGAYLKGMDHAFYKMNASVVFEFDADLSHDPSKIPEFLKQIDTGADMVLGSRYIEGGGIPKDWGIHRKFLSITGNAIIALVLTNFSIKDWTTGYRAITKKVYEAVSPAMKSERFSGYTFQIGFLHNAVMHGFKIVEVPFQFIDRTNGKSKLGPEYIKNTLLYIFRARIKSLLQNRIIKFVIVGGVGALTQLLTLQLYRFLLPDFTFIFITKYLLATFLSIETSVLSNFMLSNMWTFADRKLALHNYPAKFLQFNLASFGSILIQLIIAFIGQFAIGIFPLFTVPFINFTVDTGVIYAIVGILIGMFWNFFAYNRFIWKKK